MELKILLVIQSMHNDSLDKLMVFLTSLANGGWFWICLGILLLIPKKTRLLGFTVFLSLTFMHIICNMGLKPLVKRPRPCWTYQVPMLVETLKDYSFPSGHTYASFASSLPIALRYKKTGICLMILSSLIGFSRLYLFVHWPSDVLGGLILGLLTGLISYKITMKYEGELNKFLKIY